MRFIGEIESVISSKVKIEKDWRIWLSKRGDVWVLRVEKRMRASASMSGVSVMENLRRGRSWRVENGSKTI